ncbi:hypothetical protein N7462_007074 [Penicillium macrosclerotiorum]|uniref:uncharacterized protein n=1 Tax=Penicillium macrosclerotiorum TaxID=303699 RepID=UPI00254754AB|nr:uncharacterized protein N7462_007074 [Penicillium macrosclerotiorum]KAJ5678830.1 hypothetical protein N7462_007074 [Penicillium macrosclerotiorum]
MSFHSASPEGLYHSSPTSDSNSPNSALPARVPAPATAPRPDLASSRSCVTCRRRKVRCNKRSPCSNCTKASIECIFPPPGRAPRKSKRPPDAELLSRLRRLEGVIEHLSGKNNESPAGAGTGSTSSTSPVQAPPTFPILPSVPSENANASKTTSTIAPEKEDQDGGCPFENADPKNLAPKKFENEFGRLVIDEGRSRYVSNRLWASLGDEIEELQDILDHSESEEEDYPSPESSHSGSHEGFLFGFYSLSHSLREFHPPLPKVSMLWELYKDNVAPLITIVHREAARKLLTEAAQNPDSLDKNNEALAFSIYLSAIISLNSEQCRSLLGEERTALVKRYRFAVEQALAKAGLLNTQSLVLLQAAVLFLICIRREDDSKFVWSMNSVLLRLAQGLGLHRDGTNFGLRPYETELRRRLWWHISLMDVRCSEDHGTDPMINESMFDTRLPLNINDDDITPQMTEAPPEREGCTDVTFCLIRCEITCALRRANYSCPGSRFRMGQGGPTLDRCERMIEIISSRVQTRYLNHCNMDIPIHWASAVVGRLILAKLWLVVHHPMTRKDRVENVSQATRESLFHTAIEVLEFSRLLETDPKTAKWGWLFRTNMQWHGVAFVLSEVCVRPICPVTDRAWNAIRALYSEWEKQPTHKRGMLWRPLAALMKRAAAKRAKQQEELLAKFGPHPTPFKSETPDFAAAHHHTLPQIHMPAQPSPTISSGSGSTQNNLMPANPLDVSFANGPWEALQSIFPNTNLFAPVTLDNPPLQSPVSAVNLPSGMLFNSSMGNPFMTQDTIPDTATLSWDAWDQVMRDFQMDVENDESGPATGTHITEWFA